MIVPRDFRSQKLARCRMSRRQPFVSVAARCRRRTETTVGEEHLQNAAARFAAARGRADSNSDVVSGNCGLNHYGRNREAGYFRQSYYFHPTMVDIAARHR